MEDQVFEFTAMRGRQAGREYYLLLCPLKLIPKIFSFDNPSIPPELRQHRTLHKRKIQEIKKYLLDHPKDYVLSPITASVDSTIAFMAIGQEPHQRNIGILRIPMLAHIMINDGQHRQAAIQEALKANPNLESEQIGVTLFVDRGLRRLQQMFTDLNQGAARPAKSFRILHDHSSLSQLANMQQ